MEKARVLIVDDEESIRITLAEFIKENGYSIKTASSGPEALALIEKKNFDVIVSDIVLPGMSGIILLQKIRQKSPDTQVIMLTGDPTVETASEAVRAGAFDYLTKPLTKQAIKNTVRNAAKVKKLNDEKKLLARQNAEHQEQLERLVQERTQELQNSEARYRAIVQYQTECIDRWQPDGTLTFVNDAYCKFYGKPRDQLIGTPWMDSVLEEDKKKASAHIEHLKSTVTPQNPLLSSQHREVSGDGSIRWMEWKDQALFDEGNNLVEFQSVGRDITNLKQAQEREHQLLQQQIAMNKLSLALGTSNSLQDIYKTVHKYVSELIPTDAFYISSYNKNERIIRAEYVCDEYGHLVDPQTLPALNLERPGHGTQSQVIRSGKPMYIPDLLQIMEKIEVSYDIADDGTVTKDTVPYNMQEDVPRSELLAPMLLRGEVIGVIGVESNQVDAYDSRNLDLLSGLANVAAVAIENARLQRGLRKTLEETIHVVGLTTEMRDAYTARHQEKVASLACAIAREMDIPQQQIDGINAAGLLHDIGKIAIPSEILTKPTRLSHVEFQLIRTHPQVAYDILKGIEFPWPVAEIVLQHHERMDGSGYPNELSGDQIMLEARILAVADVVEAMSSYRPYREALGLDAALLEIKKGKGSLFDPDVCNACLALFEKGFVLDKV